MSERAALRPAREVIEEIERRAQREEHEAADAFAAIMDEAIARHQRGQSMRVQVKQAHVAIAVEMLEEAGYRYKLAASHPLDGERVVVIEIDMSAEVRNEV